MRRQPYHLENRSQLLTKRNRLLDRLHQAGHLNTLDLHLAKIEALPQKPLALPNTAAHLLDTLKKQHPKQHVFKTTLNALLQQQIITIAQNHKQTLSQNNINNVSILVIDHHDHTVRAYLGNQSDNTKRDYAPAVDIIQRPRSSGSLFKPFLFALMLQRGDLTPESLVLDTPSHYRGYSPKNYDRHYRGAVTASDALVQSLNVPAVNLLQQYGVSLFKDDLQQMGLSTLFRAADGYGLTLILGGAETSLWDITNAYAGLTQAALGLHQSRHASTFHHADILLNVQTNHRKYSYPIKQGAAWLTLEALKKVRRPGVAAAWQQFSSSQTIAWKTGTSHGWHDAWAVGTNHRYTVGVWAGNANNEEGRQLTGTQATAPVMFDVFRVLPHTPWPEKPYAALKPYVVCQQDAYLVVADCPSKIVDMPIEAKLTKSSPYHRRIHVDKTGQRVHGECEAVINMVSKTQFILPPVAEYYYKQHNAHYPTPPVWRHDCLQQKNLLVDEVPMQLEYPTEGAAIKIPIELNGRLGRIVLRAQHREPSRRIYWHINTDYLGDTLYIHEKAIVLNPGWHQLTLVDDHGYRLSRWFRYLKRDLPCKGLETVNSQTSLSNGLLTESITKKQTYFKQQQHGKC